MSADAAMTMNVLFIIHSPLSACADSRRRLCSHRHARDDESCALGSSSSRGVSKTSVVGTAVVLRRQIEQGNRGPQHSVQTRFAHRAGTRDVTDLALESEGSPVEHPSGTGAGPAEGWHQ